MRISHSLAIASCLAAGACGGGGGSPDARRIDAATTPDAVRPDAKPIDAGPPDAIPIDAPPPDAPLPCDPGPFTSGVSTLAGCDTQGAVDGVRGIARFANPVGVIHGASGEVFVADFDNDHVRAVAADGTTRTVVAQSNFARPYGLAVASDGTVYASTDTDDHGVHNLTSGTIWRVDPVLDTATVVARDLGRARGMVVLGDGRIVFSDYLHQVVNLLNPTTGVVTLLAGGADMPGFMDAQGAAARFDQPYGLALLPDGRILVADYANSRLRAVALDGTVTTIAGTGTAGHDDGPIATATLSSPKDVAVDTAGDIFVADDGNVVVREITGGMVSTKVGSGASGWLDSDNLLAAQFYGMEGIDVSSDGHTLWIADGNRGEVAPFNRVRIVALP